MKSKKGAVLFSIMLVIFMVILLLYAWSLLMSKYKVFNKNIGERQFSLIRTYQEAEKALFYIDQSAKYSLQQAVYELGKDGGLSEVPASEVLISREEVYFPSAVRKCSKFYGYSLWREKDANCFDKNKININLFYLLNKNLNQHLIIYPFNVPLDNYFYELKNSEIIGKAISPLKFDIPKDEKKPIERRSEPVKIPEIPKNFIGFSGTELCAKGKKCILTEEAFRRLEKAQLRARELGVSLYITDGYRSKEEQIAIWEGRTADNYKLRYPNEDERKLVVCYPYGEYVERSCPHLTGNSVDIYFKGKNKNTMTIADYKLLHRIMTQVKLGDKRDNYWIRYSREPWHFECCETVRYSRAIELEEKTGQPVTEIA